MNTILCFIFRPFGLLSCLLVALCVGNACAGEVDDKVADGFADPFSMLIDVPASVDLAIVLNNPAQTMMLSKPGLSLRKLLAAGGMFAQSEQAWDTLASTFGTSAEDTIRSLLGQRVVLMWDELGSESSPLLAVFREMNARWALMCEVEPKYLEQIQMHLKPVPRAIEHGFTVYAIEKGRYELVLIPPRADRGALVVLSPRSGRAILVETLGMLRGGEQKQGDSRPISIVHGESRLAGRVPSDAQRWRMAWVMRLDRFADVSEGSLEARKSTLMGVLQIHEGVLDVSFAADGDFGVPENDAPVSLLSAVGDDAIFAMAVARLPRIFVDSGTIGYMFQLKLGDQGEGDLNDSLGEGSALREEFVGGPGLMMLSDLDRQDPSASTRQSLEDPALEEQAFVGFTVITTIGLDQADNGSAAVRVDRVVHDLFSAIDPKNAPNHLGRFPSAVRTHQLDKPERLADQAQVGDDTWPGEHARFSWMSSELSGVDALITTLGPDGADTAGQVRWVAQAAETLGAISEQAGRSGVLSEGFFWPSRAMEVFGASSVDMAVSKLIERVEWRVDRVPEGVNGLVSLKVSPSGYSWLGKERARSKQ